MYVSDFSAEVVYEWINGKLAPVAGNGTRGYTGDGGPAIAAQLDQPSALALDSAGNLYIADAHNFAVRKVSKGLITTVAGNGTVGFSGDGGPATKAQLSGLGGIATDASGNLFISDNGRIRKVSNGVITTIAGTGTLGFSGENVLASMAAIEADRLAVDAAGDIYFSEQQASRIRVMRACAAPCIPVPAITSVFNGASLQPGIAAGSWVTIMGTNLANSTRSWIPAEIVSGTLPATLDGVSVTIDGLPAFLDYVSPTQINLQAPSDTNTGAVTVVVTNNGAAGAPFTTQLQAVAPALFEHYGTGYADASRYPDYASIANPAVVPGAVASKPGDIVILWATGLGATNPATPAGVEGSSAASVTVPVTATVGGVAVPVLSAALTGGAAGLYQVAIQLPASTPSGALSVQISAGGLTSKAGLLLFVSAP